MEEIRRTHQLRVGSLSQYVPGFVHPRRSPHFWTINMYQRGFPIRRWDNTTQAFEVEYFVAFDEGSYAEAY